MRSKFYYLFLSILFISSSTSALSPKSVVIGGSALASVPSLILGVVHAAQYHDLELLRTRTQPEQRAPISSASNMEIANTVLSFVDAGLGFGICACASFSNLDTKGEKVGLLFASSIATVIPAAVSVTSTLVARNLEILGAQLDAQMAWLQAGYSGFCAAAMGVASTSFLFIHVPTKGYSAQVP